MTTITIDRAVVEQALEARKVGVQEMDLNQLETRLRNIMRAVNDLERSSGLGGALAETVQENCNAIAKDAGSRVRFGLGGENPTAHGRTYGLRSGRAAAPSSGLRQNWEGA